MKDLTENQKQFIRNWVAIRNTEVEEIDGEIDKVIQNSPITKKEWKNDSRFKFTRRSN